ncbi:hypothetical protein EV424DRAFT_1348849 [Suillus variegatus]|nr:hypothetical protein EV424DRAFT_1348849 [Suillus variegatus]
MILPSKTFLGYVIFTSTWIIIIIFNSDVHVNIRLETPFLLPNCTLEKISEVVSDNSSASDLLSDLRTLRRFCYSIQISKDRWLTTTAQHPSARCKTLKKQALVYVRYHEA